MLTRTGRVLVARQDNAGDVLLSGPAVRAVAAAGPEVVYLCGPRGAAAARLLPGVSEVVVADAPWIDLEPGSVTRASMLHLADRLAALVADQAVILTSFHQSPLPLALLLRMAGVPTVAAVSVDYPGSLLDVRHQVPDDVHEVQRSLSLVGALGYRLPPGDDGRLRVVVPPDEPCLAEAAVACLPEPYVVVHPGASVPARTWAPEAMAELVGILAASGHHVVVTGTAGEKDLVGRVCAPAAATGRVTNLAGATSLAGLAAVLRWAQVLVTGNTGPAHLAAAVGTPVVSIYAPTVPAVRWQPWMVPHVLLGRQDIGCAGCRARTCPVPGHPCIDAIDPQDVAAATGALAAGAPRAVPA